MTAITILLFCPASNTDDNYGSNRNVRKEKMSKKGKAAIATGFLNSPFNYEAPSGKSLSVYLTITRTEGQNEHNNFDIIIIIEIIGFQKQM